MWMMLKELMQKMIRKCNWGFTGCIAALAAVNTDMNWCCRKP